MGSIRWQIEKERKTFHATSFKYIMCISLVSLLKHRACWSSGTKHLISLTCVASFHCFLPFGQYLLFFQFPYLQEKAPIFWAFNVLPKINEFGWLDFNIPSFTEALFKNNKKFCPQNPWPYSVVKSFVMHAELFDCDFYISICQFFHCYLFLANCQHSKVVGAWQEVNKVIVIFCWITYTHRRIRKFIACFKYS